LYGCGGKEAEAWDIEGFEDGSEGMFVCALDTPLGNMDEEDEDNRHTADWKVDVEASD
jgi:hypothetical protein